MQYQKSSLLFAMLVLAAATFVWRSSVHLPAMVASHFDAAGAANGFMLQAFYLRLMLLLVLGLPTQMVLLTWYAIGKPEARINLPNKDFWLAPERRGATIAYLRNGIVWFGIMLLALLCYMHWLVVLANAAQPPRLSSAGFIGGLLAFFIVLFIWLRRLLARFRHRVA